MVPSSLLECQAVMAQGVFKKGAFEGEAGFIRGDDIELASGEHAIETSNFVRCKGLLEVGGGAHVTSLTPDQARFITFFKTRQPSMSPLDTSGAVYVAGTASGKTLTAVWCAVYILVREPLPVLVLVHDKTVINVWKKNFEYYTTPLGIPITVVDTVKKMATVAVSTRGLVLMTKTTLMLGGRAQDPPMRQKCYSLLIVDECHDGRSPAKESATQESIAHVSRRSALKLGLTATPLVNSRKDLLHIMKTLNLGNALHSWVSCAVYVESSTDSAYDRVSWKHAKSYGKYAVGEEHASVINYVRRLGGEHTSRLKKVEFHPGLLCRPASHATLASYVTSAMWYTGELLVNLLPRGKVIIWSCSPDKLHIMQHYLHREGLTRDSILLTGADTKAEQIRKIHSFQSSVTSSQVLLMSAVANQGINLGVANSIVFLDIPWSLAHWKQAVGRMDRGEKKVEQQIHVLFRDSSSSQSAVVDCFYDAKATEMKDFGLPTYDFPTSKKRAQKEDGGREKKRKMERRLIRNVGSPAIDPAFNIRFSPEIESMFARFSAKASHRAENREGQ